MHQDLLQLQAYQNSADDPKTQVSKIMIFWDHLDWCLGARWPKLPISLEHFWATILSLDRNDINNLGPKDHPFKIILIGEEMLQPGGPCMACIIAQSRQIKRMKKKKNRTKENWLSCHALEKFELSLNKNQESQKKCWENDENKLHKSKAFSLQRIALQFRYLYLRWEMAMFHHSFTDVEKLSDSLPFEPDNFLSITQPRITP